jgi:pyruvate/2-oxoglutarate/acetoin dehydrogenase E1 component
VLGSQIGSPGFRFIALSQRLFPTELLELKADFVAPDCSIFRYRSGAEATIACLNFSLPEGLSLADRLGRSGLSSSVFSINPVFPIDWSPIVADVARTGRLIVVDDTKGALSMGSDLLNATSEAVPKSRRAIARRARSIPFGIDSEQFNVDYAELVRAVFDDELVAKLTYELSDARSNLLL